MKQYTSGKFADSISATLAPLPTLSGAPAEININANAVAFARNEKDNLECTTKSHVFHVAGVHAISELGNSITLDHVKNAAKINSQYQDLLSAMRHGFHQK